MRFYPSIILVVALSLVSSLPISQALPRVSSSPLTLQEVHPDSIFRPASLTVPGAPPYTPFEIRKAYNFLPLYSRGVQGNNTRIAIIDAFGSPSLQTDLASFDSLTGLPPATVNFYYPDGVPKRTSSNWPLETSLDVEWAHSIAPGATIDEVVALDSTLGSVFDAISFVASSLPNENVLSMSFGLSESLYPTTGSFTIAATHQLFVTITSHGTTPIASSGDVGASSCCNIEYPASDPLVVAVGGTSLFLNPDASYAGESAWSGSTAGASIVFSKPSWQVGLGDSMRDDVDVSYDADLSTGVLVVFGNRLFQVGGTSAGAPQWSGLFALAGQAHLAKYGAANQLLYKISTYHDITTGSNGFFSATVGWDYPTGWGTPNANSTVTALLTSGSVAVTSTVNLQGFTVITNGTITVNAGSLSLTGLLTASARNSSTGVQLFSKTYAVPSLKLQNHTSSFIGLFLLNLAVTPYVLSSDIMVSLTGGAVTVSVSVTRQVDINMDGTVDIVDFSAVAFAYGSPVGSPNYNPLADFDADGKVDILDFGIIAFYYGAPNLK